MIYQDVTVMNFQALHYQLKKHTALKTTQMFINTALITLGYGPPIN